VETLYSRLPPSKDGSEIEMKMAETGGGGIPLNTENGANGDG